MAVVHATRTRRAANWAAAFALVQDVSINDGDVVEVLGYNAIGDGGGQLVWFDVGDDSTPIDGGFVFPGVGGSLSFDASNVFNGTPGSGRFKAVSVYGEVDPMTFGATGDGTTDDLAVLKRAGSSAAASDAILVLTHMHMISAQWQPEVSLLGRGGGIATNATPANLDQTIMLFQFDGGFIRNVKIAGNGKTKGIVLAQCNRTIVSGCKVTNCEGAGIRLDLSHDCSVVDNHVNGVVYSASGSGAADGIYLGGCNRTKVERNIVEDFRRIGIVSESNGNHSFNSIIKMNTVRNANNCDDSSTEYNAAIWVENTIGSVIENNVCYDINNNTGQTSNRVRGIAVGIANLAGHDSHTVANNTIEFEEATGTQQFAIVVSRNSNASGHRVISINNNTITGSSGITVSGGSSSTDSTKHVDVVGNTIIDGYQTGVNGFLTFEGHIDSVNVLSFSPKNCTYESTNNGSDIALQSSAVIGSIVIDSCDGIRCYQHTNVITNDQVSKLTLKNSTLLLKDFPVSNSTYPAVWGLETEIVDCKIVDGVATDTGANTREFIAGNGKLSVRGSTLVNVSCNSGNTYGANSNNSFEWEFKDCRFEDSQISMYGSGGSGSIRIENCVFDDWPDAIGAFRVGMSTGDISIVVKHSTLKTGTTTPFTVSSGNHPTAVFEDNEIGSGVPALHSYTTGPLMRLRGPGSPEGSVSAGVGSEYTQTNGTVGNIKWWKISGTGNTGWRRIDSGAIQTLTVGATIAYDVFLGNNAECPSPTAGNTFANLTNAVPGDEGQLKIQGSANNPSWGANWDFGPDDGWTLTTTTTESAIVSWKVASNGKIDAVVTQGHASPF